MQMTYFPTDKNAMNAELYFLIYIFFFNLSVALVPNRFLVYMPINPEIWSILKTHSFQMVDSFELRLFLLSQKYFIFKLTYSFCLFWYSL